MKVKINLVQSEDYGEDTIKENWIYVKLKSGREIEIFDDIAFNFNDLEGKKANFFVESGLYSLLNIDKEGINIKNRKNKIFKGKYLKSFQLQDNWEKANWESPESYNYYKNYHYALETEDGYIILGDISKIEERNIKEGEEIILDFSRLDLTAWYPEKE